MTPRSVRIGVAAVRVLPVAIVLVAVLLAARAAVSQSPVLPGAATNDGGTGAPAAPPTGSAAGTGPGSTSSGSSGSASSPGSPAPSGAAPTPSSPGSPSGPGGSGGGASPPAPSGDVAIVTPLLDAFETGANAGPGTFLGTVNALVSIAVAPLSEIPGGSDVAALISTVLSKMQQPAAEFRAVLINAIETLRDVAAELAPLNPTLDQALVASAERLDYVVAHYGEQIQPFDGMLAFFADVLRSQTSRS